MKLRVQLLTDKKKIAEEISLIESRRARNLGEPIFVQRCISVIVCSPVSNDAKEV